MSPLLRILIFFLLPLVAVLLFPPEILLGSIPVVAVAMLAFGLLGLALWQKRRWALTLAIFLLGFNAIVRLMIFVAHAVPRGGQPDFSVIITYLLSIALSVYLLLRLDKVDVRSYVSR